MTVCQRLGARGISSTVCYWNAFLDSPARVLDSYLRILRVIKDLSHDCYLSIKAPALGFDAGLVKELMLEAQRASTAVHFDSMGPETIDRTFALIDTTRRFYPNIGCTLPARWVRSLADVDRAADMGLRVRLVKGQWSGLKEVNPAEGFIHLIERLISRGASHVAIATHNHSVASDALLRLRASGIPCELELLHSLPQRRMLKVARRTGAATRVYVPYGHGGLPYRLREVRRDPRILLWFMRDLIRA